MKRFTYFVAAFALLLTSCEAQKNSAWQMDSDTSSEQAASLHFESKEVGVYSTMSAPPDVSIEHSQRFVLSQEPAFSDGIGNIMASKEIEDFCNVSSSQNRIFVSCELITENYPHAEFYFAEFNPYIEEYQSIGRYAIFKTQSLVSPAFLLSQTIELPAELDVRDEKAVQEFLRSEASSPSNSEAHASFRNFVRSIVIRPPSKVEPEWLTFVSQEKGFSINYPNGLSPNSIWKDSVFSLGPDGEFLISFYPTREKLDEALSSYWSHIENKEISRSNITIGSNEGELVTIFIKSEYGGGIEYKYYVFKTHSGYIVLSYDKHYFEGFEEMPLTLKIW